MEKLHLDQQNSFEIAGSSFLATENLADHLNYDIASFCIDDLNKILLNPLLKFTNNSSNFFRSRLVELSISLCSDKSLVFTKQFQKKISQNLSKLIEALHTGSLIIDDIQDNANVRRGKPSFHTEIGTPLAINSGSWLYFWALSHISSMSLEPQVELDITRLCHQALMRGHLGQALDLGIRIDEVSQSKAREVSISALQLKTGTLTSLACELAAVVCGVHTEVRLAFKNFGASFGFALQAFNDLGEFSIRDKNISQDLIAGRPSWIWICASEYLTMTEYMEFTAQVHRLRRSDSGSKEKTMMWLKQHPVVSFARSQANIIMNNSFNKLSNQLNQFDYELNQRFDWKELQLLGQKVSEIYD